MVVLFHQKWKKNWFVLYPASQNGIARLEFFESSGSGGVGGGSGANSNEKTRKLDKKIIRLSECISILPALTENCPKDNMAAFCVETNDKNHVFAAEKNAAKEWMNTMCDIAFQVSFFLLWLLLVGAFACQWLQNVPFHSQLFLWPMYGLHHHFGDQNRFALPSALAIHHLLFFLKRGIATNVATEKTFREDEVVSPQGGSGGNGDSDAESQDLKMSENLIYYSREEGEDATEAENCRIRKLLGEKNFCIYIYISVVNEFWVSVQRTEASDRCRLSGNYWLKAESKVLILKEPKTKRNVFVWPYKLLRRYGRDRVGARIRQCGCVRVHVVRTSSAVRGCGRSFHRRLLKSVK